MSIWKQIRRSAAVGLGWGLFLGASPALATDDPTFPPPPACEGELELIAIVYVADDPARSMALVGIKGSSLVRIGSWVGERRVLALGPRSLVLGPAEDACVMRLAQRSPRRPARPARRKRSRSKRRR
ncbi:MAG: hypothetical protein JRE81_06585 [Deltaproteobacteria bacterium]|nr:hypothetical protein [Deltaproteobacteria bacterium]